MPEDFVLNAETREDEGKGASRRLRRLENKVPAIIYGGKKKPANIKLLHKDLIKQLENEAFYSHIITINVDGKEESVILKDLQRHPAKLAVLHADFFRISKTKKFQTNSPLHFINEDTCHGVKVEGGVISHTMTSIEVSCLPADLPEFIEVDMAAVELGQTLHISDVKLPKGVTSVALSHGEDHDLPVVSVNKAKAVVVDEDPVEPAADEDQAPAED